MILQTVQKYHHEKRALKTRFSNADSLQYNIYCKMNGSMDTFYGFDLNVTLNNNSPKK